MVLRLACDVRPRALIRQQSTKPRVKKKALGSAFSRPLTVWVLERKKHRFERILITCDCFVKIQYFWFLLALGGMFQVGSSSPSRAKEPASGLVLRLVSWHLSLLLLTSLPIFQGLEPWLLAEHVYFACDGRLKYFRRRARAETHALCQLILQDGLLFVILVLWPLCHQSLFCCASTFWCAFLVPTIDFLPGWRDGEWQIRFFSPSLGRDSDRDSMRWEMLELISLGPLKWSGIVSLKLGVISLSFSWPLLVWITLFGRSFAVPRSANETSLIW